MIELLIYIATNIALGMILASIIFINILAYWLAYKIWRVPTHIWEENRKNPSKENFEHIMEYIKK